MVRKQMEGDNQRRRALARQARESGQRPSEAGVTLGATKQIESLDHDRRQGPQPDRKRKPAQEPKGSTPAPTPPDWPTSPRQTSAARRAITIGYQELIDEVSQRTGVDFTQARAGTSATVAVLAKALDEGGRERLLDAVPRQLHDGLLTVVDRRTDLAGFLDEVARVSGQTPEQARYQAQATLNALAARDPRLMASLELPGGLAELLTPLSVGGGLVDTAGRTAPLSQEELRTALAELPYWSAGPGGLTREIVLPRANLDRVLGRLARLRAELGRGPQIGRSAPETAAVTVPITDRDGVTALEIALAHQVDAAIDEVAAGVA